MQWADECTIWLDLTSSLVLWSGAQILEVDQVGLAHIPKIKNLLFFLTIFYIYYKNNIKIFLKNSILINGLKASINRTLKSNKVYIILKALKHSPKTELMGGGSQCRFSISGLWAKFAFMQWADEFTIYSTWFPHYFREVEPRFQKLIRLD